MFAVSIRRTAILAALLVASLPGSARAGGEGGAERADAEKRLAALDTRDVAAAYKLALDLQAGGWNDLATKAYEIVVGLDPEHRAARRALGFENVGGRWAKGDDLQRAKGFVRHQNRWMTSEEFAAATRPEREAAAQKEGEGRVMAELARIASGDPDLVLAARRALGGMDDKFKLAPLAKALRCDPASLRLFAAAELARIGDPLAAPALLKRAIDDPDASVRKAVVEALRSLGEPSTVEPLCRALDSRFADVRVRAAEAIGVLGDVAAMGYVVSRWTARSGNFSNVYFSQTRQISYIQDFDVEVAQTSFIADPIVGVLQEGVVQSVKILATEHSFTTIENAAYHSALQNLAGHDLGSDAKSWSIFWRENKDRLLRERDAAYVKQAQERAAARAARADPSGSSTPR